MKKTPAPGDADANEGIRQATGFDKQPLAHAVATAPPAANKAVSGSSSILLAEDDPRARSLWTLTLARAGYAVTPVEDGLQAWETLVSKRFDLLVTDNEMPRLTGLELAAKARLEGMRLPIIMASGSANMMEGADCRWLQFAALLQKPFTPADLSKAVEEALRGLSRERRGSLFCRRPLSIE
jgi:CheY-like chemotaxis protein